MVPLKELNEHKKFEELGAVDAKVDQRYLLQRRPSGQWNSRTITSCCGTCPRPMKRPSPNDLARCGVLCLAGVFATAVAARAPAAEPLTIRLRSDAKGSHVGFAPIGLLIQPGQTVRFVCEANYHMTAAYHPGNANHSLHTPTTAKPWSSDVLRPGGHFEVTLMVPGVTTIFACCTRRPGWSVACVGQPTGPGSLPFDWFKDRPEAREWQPVPEAARKMFPPIDDMMHRGTVPARPVGMAH